MMEKKRPQRIFLPNLSIPFFTILICLILPRASLGRCIEGNCVNGQGTLQTKEGTRYVGEFRNKKSNGIGTVYFTNGNRYEGEFKNNKRHGKGTFYWAKGDKYVGEWKNNDRNGKGTLYFSKSGNRFEGEYRNNKKHGKGTFYFPNGDKFVCEYKNGKKHGFGTYTLESGEKVSGMYKNNKRVVRCDKSFYTYFNEGIYYLEQSRFDSAINIYEKITDEFDYDLYYMAQTNIAVALLKKGNLEKSEEYFDELIKELEDTDKDELESLDKLLFYSYFNRALIKFKNDDQAGAKKDLLEAKEVYPGKISRVKSMDPLYITDTNMN